MRQFYIGITIFCLATGLLVGASNTPVVGAFITAIFGVIVGAVSLFANKEKPNIHLSFHQLGYILSLFSIFLVIGTWLGVYYRSYDDPEEIFLPWSSTQPPKTAYEALDWIVVSKILKENGLTNEKISSLYKTRLEERKSIDSLKQDSYSESMPYYKMLSIFIFENKEQKTSARRGPASED